MTDSEDQNLKIRNLLWRLERLLEAAKFFAGRDTWLYRENAVNVLDKEIKRQGS